MSNLINVIGNNKFIYSSDGKGYLSNHFEVFRLDDTVEINFKNKGIIKHSDDSCLILKTKQGDLLKFDFDEVKHIRNYNIKSA